MSKDFEIDDFAAMETAKKEIINITLSRDKPIEQSLNQKPETLFPILESARRNRKSKQPFWFSPEEM